MSKKVKRIRVDCLRCNGVGKVEKVSPVSLRLVRISAGVSLRSMAKRIGIHPSYLSDIERGNRGCSPAVESHYNEL